MTEQRRVLPGENHERPLADEPATPKSLAA